VAGWKAQFRRTFQKGVGSGTEVHAKVRSHFIYIIILGDSPTDPWGLSLGGGVGGCGTVIIKYASFKI